jgi:hypothetical protein
MEVARQLAEKTNYLNKDIVYLKNTTITEYDIKSAGFTVIKFKKLLPEEEILELESIGKEERNVRIGKRILQYPRIGEEIINTLAEVRQDFVVMNQIYDNDILSIKKDAIFLIRKNPTVLKIGMFEFRAKKSYSSYCYLNKKEFYYSSSDETLELKGFTEENKVKQEGYLLKDIKKIMMMSEKLTNEQLFTFLKQYRTKYLGRQLNRETYRDIETGKFSVEGYYMEDISDEILSTADISQNYINYLLPLFNAVI